MCIGMIFPVKLKLFLREGNVLDKRVVSKKNSEEVENIPQAGVNSESQFLVGI